MSRDHNEAYPSENTDSRYDAQGHSLLWEHIKEGGKDRRLSLLWYSLDSLYRWFMRLFLPLGIVFWSNQILATSFKTVLNAWFWIQYLLRMVTYFKCSFGFQQWNQSIISSAGIVLILTDVGFTSDSLSCILFSTTNAQPWWFFILECNKLV